MKRKKPKRRIFIPGPDRRNVTRGMEWLRKMIEASEENRDMDKVIDEMVSADRFSGENDQ